MATFTWNNLTVHVGEMNRAVALQTAREINNLIDAIGDAEECSLQIDTVMAVNSPALVRVDGQVVNGNGVAIEVDGLPVAFKLPLTAEAFNALPLSLSAAWSLAAISANGWLKEASKNAESRATETKTEPPSGSLSLNAS